MKSGSLLIAMFLSMAPLAAQAWKLATADTPFTSTSYRYTVQVPVGWRYTGFSNNLGASRDGPGLNAIHVEVRKHKKAFPALKKGSSGTTPVDELAENYLANLQTGGSKDVQVLANEPALLGDRPAFRLTYTYRTPVEEGAVRYGEIVVGTTNDKGLVLLRYRAPLLHYYPLGLSAFEATLASFTFVAATPKK